MRQAVGAAQWLAKFLARSTGEATLVKAVIAVPGWWCDPNNFENVRIRNTKMLAVELAKLPTTLDRAQIQRIVHQLDQKCRDVKF